MRVLAVRSRNLASLADPFEVDLASEPLAWTALFFVTSETGVGKSTILDALCLSLYGWYPSLAAGGDPHRLASGFCGQVGVERRPYFQHGAGHAEVDIVGVDGVGYRARCEASRARGRAGGRLRPEARLLPRLRDGTALVEGKLDVLDAVELAKGSTFAQFRRTALLAQGEFDSFLFAGDGDRAELLEKIPARTSAPRRRCVCTRARRQSDA